MFVSHHTLKWTRTCRSHGRHPHAHTAHFLLNRHIEVFHTDRGGEFTGERIERMLDVFGITRSLSRPGNPYDNAVVESTNRLVKKELIHRNVYTNVEQLRSDVNRYVWWYNHQRLHSTLGYLSPVEFTQQGKTL